MSRYVKDLGKAGEDAAADFLLSRGVVVLKRNFRAITGEIDIIGEYDGLILFVEVKTRTGTRFGRGGEAVDFRKRRKIIATAGVFLQQNNLEGRNCRFDVLEVYPNADGSFHIVPIAGAFEA